MKSREPRQTIQVTARMKSGDGWQDVAIRNVSAHGMRVSMALPPQRGAVIEIRRASQIIIARAVWVHDYDCGLRTQDVVDVPALLNPHAARAETVVREALADRRSAPRIAETAETSRRFAQRFQQAAMAAAVLAGAGYLTWQVSDILRRPFASVSAALGGTSPEPMDAAAPAPAN